MVIHPWVPPDSNALSDISFTPQVCDPKEIGGRADEVLLHEFIHVLDNEYSQYIDAMGFQFDGTDFLSVNATNVYSSLLGRRLRLDHHGSLAMPNDPYVINPRQHFDDFRANYDRAKGAAPQL